MKTTLVLKKWLSEGTPPPAKFYLTNMYGDYIFLHASTLHEAKDWAEGNHPSSEVGISLLGHKRTYNERTQ